MVNFNSINNDLYQLQKSVNSLSQNKQTSLIQKTRHTKDLASQIFQTMSKIENINQQTELHNFKTLLTNILLLENEIFHLPEDQLKIFKESTVKIFNVKQSVFNIIKNNTDHGFKERIKKRLEDVSDRLNQPHEISKEELINLKLELKKINHEIYKKDPDSYTHNHSSWAGTVQSKISTYLSIIEEQETHFSKSVSQVYAEASQLRSQITSSRQHAEETLGTLPASQVSAKLSEDFCKLIGNLYQDGIAELRSRYGEPPCDFCIIFFGSLGRGESGPYPDIDHGMLVESKTPQSIKYFEKLNQFVADRIFRLGETFDKPGLSFCSGNMNPPYQGYNLRYSEGIPGEMEELRIKIEDATQQELNAIEEVKAHPSPENQRKLRSLSNTLRNSQDRLNFLENLGPARRGSGHLLEEPQTFARWQSYYPPNTNDKNMDEKIASMIDIQVYPNVGQPTLFNSFRKQVDQNSTTTSNSVSFREDQAKKNLEFIAGWIATSKLLITSKAISTMNVKTDLYRFPQVVIANLAILNHIEEQNSFKRIDRLIEKGVFSKEFGKQLSETLEFIVGLRIKTQLSFGEECEYLSTQTKEEIIKNRDDMEKGINVLKSIIDQNQANIENYSKQYAKLEAEEQEDNAMIFNELEMADLVAKINMENASKEECLANLETSLETIKRYNKILTLPDTAHPTLSTSQVEELNTKHIPVLKKLYRMTALATDKGLDTSHFNP